MQTAGSQSACNTFIIYNNECASAIHHKFKEGIAAGRVLGVPLRPDGCSAAKTPAQRLRESCLQQQQRHEYDDARASA
jgi:hypothetical protein